MEYCNTKVHGSEGLEPDEAVSRASILLSKALCIPVKRPYSRARLPLLVGSRRMKTDRDRKSALALESSRFVPMIVVHKGSALRPGSSTIKLISTLAGSWAYLADRAYDGTLARVSTPYQASRDSATCLSCAISSRRAPDWCSEEAHRVDTILHQPNRRRVSTDRLNSVDSQLVLLLRVSPAIHPLERPSHTHTPKPRLRRDRENYYHHCFRIIFGELL